jgi:hypothetical protein
MNLDLSKVRPVVFSPDSGCNTSDEALIGQVKDNICRGIQQVQPHTPQPNQVALLVCGGPSLAETERDLAKAYWSGGKIIAVNGAYKWCIERNLKPSAAVLLDAREFNARFIEEDVPGCKYLLASQCHPRAFEICKDRNTFIWHACSGGDAEVEILKEYYFGRVFPVTIGTTVGVRAISLLRMLGFLKIEIFGLDSCWLDDKHHAYQQVENEKDMNVEVWLTPQGRADMARKFICAPWHMKQAEDFQRLIKERGDMFELHVHGRGLIAAILETGADIVKQEDTTTAAA